MEYYFSESKLRDDLFWAIGSPDMMSLKNNLCEIPKQQALKQWFDSDNHAARIKTYIEERQPRRLGIYFEALWHYFLEHHPDFDFISRNLPVRNQGHTLGEFDFIYYCRHRQHHVHLETAVKFYLQVTPKGEPHSQWRYWIGPGSKDRLDLKLNKMLNQQTQLSKTPEGAKELKRLGVTDIVSEVCLKGYLFYPFNSLEIPPENASEAHLKGFWLRQRELKQLPKSNAWLILRKPSWLSPAIASDSTELLEFSQLTHYLHEHFQQNKFPVMLALMNENDGVFREQARFFVTSNHWPG